ncbi:MAG TPA: flagellar filament capping protein FliD [Patescibacteria group bacterium]|nr:flagellar filament capping protein FliD [Patescibacteria group bacterium]
MSTTGVTTSTVNGVTRATGLVSGIDVDSIVEALVTAKSTKLDKLKQREQLAEWRQEAYQTITSEVSAFSSTYFDSTSSSCLFKQSTFQQYSTTSSNTAVSVSTTSKASTGSHTVAVSQLASAATLKTTGTLSKDIEGASAVDYTSLSGTSFVVTIDDTATTVTLDDDILSESGESSWNLTSLQYAIDDAVGSGKITVSEDSSSILSITAASTTSGVQEIAISAPTSSTSTSALTALGFGSGSTLSNRISTSDTLEDLASAFGTSFTFDSDDQVELSINGVSLTFDKSVTLSEMMSTVNESDAGVTMEYDELNDQLVLTADTTGAQKTLVVSETGSTFLSAALGTATAGTDAKLTIDGTSYTRSSNSLTVDGVTYTLNDVTETDEDATITITQDVDAVYDTISQFVEDYNALISTINDTLDEEYDSDYPPLTDAEKEDMTDEQITNWETQAKTGLLANDSTVQSMLDDIRLALYDSVSGVSLDLASIGITTDSYDEEGKLYIDEDTLMSALEDDATSVMNLFTQSSSTYSNSSRALSSTERSARYEEQGIAYRLYNVIQDNISTSTDSAGNRGALVEKAGIADEDYDNTLTDEIDELQDRIDDEEDNIDDYEEYLYDKYTAMETYISTMNSQLTALLSSLSTSSSS